MCRRRGEWRIFTSNRLIIISFLSFITILNIFLGRLASHKYTFWLFPRSNCWCFLKKKKKKILHNSWLASGAEKQHAQLQRCWPLLFHRKVGQTHIKTSWWSGKFSEFIIFLIFKRRRRSMRQKPNQSARLTSLWLSLSWWMPKYRTQEIKGAPQTIAQFPINVDYC